MDRIGSPPYIKELENLINNLISVKEYYDNNVFPTELERSDINCAKKRIIEYLDPAIKQNSSLKKENNRLCRKSEYYKKIAEKYAPKKIIPFETIDEEIWEE
jgi:hypothetical protein